MWLYGWDDLVEEFLIELWFEGEDRWFGEYGVG